MATKPLSAALRAQLCKRILDRVEDLQLNYADAAHRLRFSSAQMSRLASGQDIFSLDRLGDAAALIGLSVRISATRPYRHS